MADFQIPEEAIKSQAAKDGITHFCTGLMVMRDGKALVVRRIKSDSYGGMYEIPGGGVDEGETIAEGAIRELKEETGLELKSFIAMFDSFDYTTRKKLKVRQINLIVEAGDGPIQLDPAEHDDYKYVGLPEIDDLECTPLMKTCIRDGLSRVK